MTAGQSYLAILRERCSLFEAIAHELPLLTDVYRSFLSICKSYGLWIQKTLAVC
jgi:hypothetical protein